MNCVRRGFIIILITIIILTVSHIKMAFSECLHFQYLVTYKQR